MIGKIFETVLETTEEETRQLADTLAKEAAAEAGAVPGASGLVAHHVAERAAKIAVLKIFGLSDAPEQGSVLNKDPYDIANGTVGADGSGNDPEFYVVTERQAARTAR